MALTIVVVVVIVVFLVSAVVAVKSAVPQCRSTYMQYECQMQEGHRLPHGDGTGRIWW